MTELKSIRIGKGMTQKEAAALLGVSLRSYVSYENETDKTGSAKYRFLLRELQENSRLDENHGILTREEIKKRCENVLREYPVDFCYLFGSYATNKASGESDVDLIISTDVTGLSFYELAERLRRSLQKRVDLLDARQLLNNEELLKAILKEGIRIYG